MTDDDEKTRTALLVVREREVGRLRLLERVAKTGRTARKIDMLRELGESDGPVGFWVVVGDADVRECYVEELRINSYGVWIGEKTEE